MCRDKGADPQPEPLLEDQATVAALVYEAVKCFCETPHTVLYPEAAVCRTEVSIPPELWVIESCAAPRQGPTTPNQDRRRLIQTRLEGAGQGKLGVLCPESGHASPGTPLGLQP